MTSSLLSVVPFQLPLVEMKHDYAFIDSKTGKSVNLTDMFDGRPQLITYHTMFDPSWDDARPSCTAYFDHVPPLEHLYSRDVSYVVVSHAKPQQIKKFKEKMGFSRFNWYSSHDSNFNYDFHVSHPNPDGTPAEYNFRSAEDHIAKGIEFFTMAELPGHSIFAKGGNAEDGGCGGGEKGKVYHSHSNYGRGGEAMMSTFTWLDWVPMGRQDGKLEGVGGLGFRRRGEYKDEEIKGKPV